MLGESKISCSCFLSSTTPWWLRWDNNSKQNQKQCWGNCGAKFSPPPFVSCFRMDQIEWFSGGGVGGQDRGPGTSSPPPMCILYIAHITSGDLWWGGGGGHDRGPGTSSPPPYVKPANWPYDLWKPLVGGSGQKSWDIPEPQNGRPAVTAGCTDFFWTSHKQPAN